MRIVFSKDRPAQLDLLLQSLAQNAPQERTVIIAHASDKDYRAGYRLVRRYWPKGIRIDYTEPHHFEREVRKRLTQDDLVTFFCDDDVLFAPYSPNGELADERVIALSLRLGDNTTFCYPARRPQHIPLVPLWWWQEDGDGDFGYPGSLDGHVFRAADVRLALAGRSFQNPTELEDALQAGCRALGDKRPLLASYVHSRLCSVPVNRVSEQSQVRFGRAHAQRAAWLNERFLGGERIDFGALDFSAVDSPHYEMLYEWRAA